MQIFLDSEPILKILSANFLVLTAWIDGTAILIAVVVVASVGSLVDWRKEIEFVTQANNGAKGNVVSSGSFFK